METYNIKVKTDSPKTGIVSFDEPTRTFFVQVKASPEKGKANFELIKLFTKHFKKKVSIVMGFTSKKKVIRVQ